MFKLVVLLSVVAMAVAKPNLVVPYAYSTVGVAPGVSSVSQYSSSVVHGSPAVYGTPTVYTAPGFYNAPVYSAPAVLSQAPNQPAVVLDPVNGVPLDTPEVVAARAAHYTAKALGPYHHLRKRSVGVAPLTYTAVASPLSYSSPLVSAYSAPWVTSPYAYPSVYPTAYSVHPY